MEAVMLRLLLSSLSSLLFLLFVTPVWANDVFIYYNSTQTGAEYSRLKSHYESLGFTVTGSTSTTVSSSDVSGQDLVIDIAGTSNCGSTCRSVYDSYVSGGGKLIIAAPQGASNRQSNIESLIENKMSVGTMTYYTGTCSTDRCWQSYKRSDYSTSGVTDYLPGAGQLFQASGGTAMASNSASSTYHTWYKWDYGSNGGTIIVTMGYDQFQTNLTYTSSMTSFLTEIAEDEGLYTSSSSGSSSATPIYSSGITAAQSTKRSSKLADTATHGMEAHIDIDGNYNDVNITQAGDAHYLELGVVGNSNVVDIEQATTGSAMHYADITMDGSSNTLDILQTGTGPKTAFIGIDGDSNTAEVIQKDAGSHYLQLDLIGDSHDATIVQEGSGNHEATVELTNGGGAWTFELNQQGSTSKEYSLPHSMSDGSTTSGTCYVSAGCSLTVTQQD
jgi:hypothetical protein